MSLLTKFKYSISISAILLVSAAYAATGDSPAPAPSPASVAELLYQYNYIEGEIDGLLRRVKKIEADIDTMQCDLRVFDTRMGELSDSMIQLRRQCGEYLVTARKIRKTTPEISLTNSRKKLYSSIRRNGYINSDIFKARRELRELTDEYFAVFNEKERIRYLIDHESDLYAMHDNISDRIDVLESKSADVVTLINPRLNEAEAILRSRNAKAANLDKLLASEYVVRVKRDRKPAVPDAGKDIRGQVETVVTDAAAQTGDFGSNIGVLMFPVSGKYNIVGRFGRYPHPEFERITIYNPGIDIEVGSGSKARAVFPGKVEAIYDIPGYNKVVVVSHGDYYTVYGNLAEIKVTEDMEVKDGQIVGSVTNDKGHSVLHFEVRLGSDALDPMQWVKL